jgi:hypothetical protein
MFPPPIIKSFPFAGWGDLFCALFKKGTAIMKVSKRILIIAYIVYLLLKDLALYPGVKNYFQQSTICC